MTNSSYILADDLSGALETGAAFRARGWKVTLPLDPTAIGDGGATEIQVVSTETRASSPDDAARIVRAVVASRKAVRLGLLFKKIDSTLRGPIAAELAAVIDELEPPLVVVCPANPAAGRVVRGGELLVNGTPLAASEFKDDPQWPARSSRVGEIIAPPDGSRAAGIPLEVIRNRGAEVMIASLVADGLRMMVADAETEDDLRSLVRAVHRAEPRALLVGSGALAAAIEQDAPAPATPPAGDLWQKCRSILVVCGSANPRSHRQLEFLKSAHKVPLVTIVAERSDRDEAKRDVVEAVRARGIVLVRFACGDNFGTESARILQERISEFVGSVLHSTTIDGLVLTGGETAWTVCRKIGGVSLEVASEFEPGMVLSILSRGGLGPLPVVSKPGGFGSEGSLGLILPDEMK